MREFDYLTPKTLNEAVAILEKARGEARPLAGGTDLIDQMRMGRKSPSLVVDIKGIPELNRLEFVKKDGLHIGAAVPCAVIYQYPVVKEQYPMLAQATSLVGDIKIQNRASIGGNLCNAAPSADTAPCLIVLGGRAIIAGSKGRREVPLENFFLGPGNTVLKPGELLVEVMVPPPPPNSAGCYLRLTPRNEMDIAVVGVGTLLVVSGKGSQQCQEACIALAAVAPTPVRAREAEAYLAGRNIDESTVYQAGERAAVSARPIDDMRGSKEYRLQMVKALTRKTLRQCAETLGIKL